MEICQKWSTLVLIQAGRVHVLQDLCIQCRTQRSGNRPRCVNSGLRPQTKSATRAEPKKAARRKTLCRQGEVSLPLECSICSARKNQSIAHEADTCLQPRVSHWVTVRIGQGWLKLLTFFVPNFYQGFGVRRRNQIIIEDIERVNREDASVAFP